MTDPFHLAIPSMDLDESRRFYGELLGCEEGRSAERWVDFNFFGHQLSIHLAPAQCDQEGTNAVDGDKVPVRHFGIVLSWEDWTSMARTLEEKGVAFRIPPKVRFAGLPGEQGTLFLDDPSGNSLEFKGFRRRDSLFQT
jgi:uncharacterized protein